MTQSRKYTMAAKEKNSKKNIHTISVLVANKPGVLVRVASTFARRGFNIDSLVVSPTVDERFSRMTITAQGDLETLDQIIKQTAKLIDVLNVGEHDPERIIEKEMALFKVRYSPANKASLQKLMKQFHAGSVDTTESTMIVQVAGDTSSLDELELKLKKFGILEMVRSGKLAMARGKDLT